MIILLHQAKSYLLLASLLRADNIRGRHYIAAAKRCIEMYNDIETETTIFRLPMAA